MKRPVAAGLLLLLTACGGAARATAIPSDEIPFSLARSPAQTQPATTLAQYSLSFVLRGRLVEVTRQLGSRQPDPRPARTRAGSRRRYLHRRGF